MDLRRALDSALTGRGAASLAPAVDALMTAYRSGEPAASVLLESPVRVSAYAAYRMPSTTAAVAAALRETAGAVPGWAPASHLDLGAGTGAAAVAVAQVLPTVVTRTLLEQSAAAIELGQDVLSRGGVEADWQRWTLADVPLPEADLVTAAYVLGELTPERQALLVRLAAAAGRTVIFVEPGTPDGYRRILAARTALLEAGFAVAAPCTHQQACPLVGQNWCHMGVRTERSVLHRQLKDGDRSWEDEKFSYVAATRLPVQAPAARVLRRPVLRKGLVTLTLCQQDGTAGERLVSKKQGPVYKAARDVSWGDAWQ